MNYANYCRIIPHIFANCLFSFAFLLDRTQKKQPGLTTRLLFLFPQHSPKSHARAYNYVEYQGYTDVQGYAVEPRDVTFGWKSHRYNLIFVNGVGGHFCTFFPKFFPMLNIDGILLQAYYDAIVDIDAVTYKAVTDNNAVVARHADERILRGA